MPVLHPNTHVLHALSLPGGGWDQALALGAALREGAAGSDARLARHHVLAIGPAGTREGLAALGVSESHTFAPLGLRLPGQLDAPAAMGARRCAAWLKVFLRELPRDAHLVVHAWSVDARDLLARAMGLVGLRAPLVCTPVRGPRNAGDLACPIDAVPFPLASRWVIAGAAPRSFAPPDYQPLRASGTAVRNPAQAEREALRVAMGLSDRELLVVLLADPPAVGQARLFVSSVGIMHLADLPAHALVSHGSTDLQRAVRHTASFDYQWDVLVTDRPIASLLPAADLALWHAPECTSSGGALLAHAAACVGLPVVAARSELANWLLDSRGDARVADALIADAPTHPRWAAPMHRLAIDLAEGGGAQTRSIAAALASHARSLCHVGEPFRDVMTSLWAGASASLHPPVSEEASPAGARS